MLYVQTTTGIRRVEGNDLVRLDVPYQRLSDVIAATGSLAVLDGAASVGDPTPVPSAELQAPLERPGTIWGVGLNYWSKATLTGRPAPTEPLLFVKSAAALGGDGDVIELPSRLSSEADYEAEVGLVIGRPICDATPAEAWASVAALVVANDMTARDTMRATGSPLLAKSFPGGSPIGRSVLSTGDLAPTFDLGIRAFVNGDLRQDGRTSDVIFGPDVLLAEISRYAALEPGDIVLTGTPAGTGQDRGGAYLVDGDEIRIEVDGMLPLTNVVRAPATG